MTADELKEARQVCELLGRADGQKVHHMLARRVLADLLEAYEEQVEVCTFLRRVEGRHRRAYRCHLRFWSRLALFLAALLVSVLCVGR